MKIIKRSGKIVDFEISKVKTSVETSASDINFSLTRSDINIILNDFNTKLKTLRQEDGITSAYEVRGLIYDVLTCRSFNQVCKSYMNF